MATDPMLWHMLARVAEGLTQAGSNVASALQTKYTTQADLARAQLEKAMREALAQKQYDLQKYLGELQANTEKARIGAEKELGMKKISAEERGQNLMYQLGLAKLQAWQAIERARALGKNAIIGKLMGLIDEIEKEQQKLTDPKYLANRAKALDLTTKVRDTAEKLQTKEAVTKSTQEFTKAAQDLAESLDNPLKFGSYLWHWGKGVVYRAQDWFKKPSGTQRLQAMEQVAQTAPPGVAGELYQYSVPYVAQGFGPEGASVLADPVGTALSMKMNLLRSLLGMVDRINP